jgi:hypothetical protein
MAAFSAVAPDVRYGHLTVVMQTRCKKMRIMKRVQSLARPVDG